MNRACHFFPRKDVKVSQNRIACLFFLNSFVPTGGIRSYAQKKKVRQILAKSVNIYLSNMGFEISHRIFM